VPNWIKEIKTFLVFRLTQRFYMLDKDPFLIAPQTFETIENYSNYQAYLRSYSKSVKAFLFFPIKMIESPQTLTNK